MLVLLSEHDVDVSEGLGAVEFLRRLAGNGLKRQHPGPQIRVMVIDVAKLRLFGIGAEPAAAPVSELVDRREEPRLLANVIKLRKRVLDAMYEESKTLFANIFVNLSKKVLTNQEKCAAVFANSENGPCN